MPDKFVIESIAQHLARAFFTVVAAWLAKRGYELSGDTVAQLTAWGSAGLVVIGTTAWSVVRAKKLRDAEPPKEGGPKA
jgi:hypothetical protein